MFKGLLIYKMESNKFVPDQQDKEMTEAYNYFIQKLREAEPTISAQYADDNEFIDYFTHKQNNINKNLKDIYWEQSDGMADIELINSDMDTYYIPDIDTYYIPDIDTYQDPNIRGIWFGENWKCTADLNDFKEQLKDYLPDDFPYEKYVGAYSMTEY